MASTSTPALESEIQTTYAFKEVAPWPTSSSTVKKLPCPVFINHRGPDTKETLARAIYNALHATGLGVFLDSEELQLGDIIPAALQQAMTTASLHVAIFSPGYAQSPWCLAELCFMLQTGTTIIPVFYDVQPTDLRWVEKGMYADAFSEYKRKGRYSEERIEDWKMALQNVSYSKGEIINSNDEEDQKLKLKNIVNGVLKEMKVLQFPVVKYPVGLKDFVANFEKVVQESKNLQHPKVQIVGIWGMGGVGKTTLAKILYNRKRSNVEYYSFIVDIKEAAEKKELHIKQQSLLKELGVTNIPFFDNIEKGQEILSNRLKSVSVLIVLDDVNHSTQLDALLPMKDSLAWGSFILITTRDREVLKSWNISCTYKMEAMNPLHAKQLFCWHAFSHPSPPLGFEELVTKFTDVCNGLPLSLKVLGSLLKSHSSKEVWEDLLHKISKILPNDIKNILRVSYDGLDEQEKQIFLDAACFFIGEDHMKAIAVWEGSGWNCLYGWERLVDKCLVDLDDKNYIRMHDLLKDFAKEIANTEPQYRLWCPDQITAIQKQDQEKIQIRGMILDIANKGVHEFPGFLLNTRRPFPGFLLSRRRPFRLELTILVVKGNNRDKLPISEFSTKLAWLSCTEIVERNLPLPMENLRVLELHYCLKLVGLWKDGPEAPEQLRMLIIRGCPKLQRIPKSIKLLKNLKQMSLDECHNLKALPEEFCCLQLLEHLQLSYCDKLLSLPSCFGELRNLRHLDLSYLKNLRMLPDSFKQLELLQHLKLAECSRLALQPDIMENMKMLEYLNFNGCGELKELPIHITNQTALRELYSEYPCLRKLPVDIGQLSRLRVMKIASQVLAESFGGLIHLEHLELTGLEVESLPLSFKQLINLQTLKIKSSRISELDFGTGPFTSSLCNLENIFLGQTEVFKLSISEECCPRLKIVEVSNSDCLREVDTLPTTVEEIRMMNCPELVELLSSAKLATLKLFTLDRLHKIEKIIGLQHCTSLEYLLIKDCPKLNSLPCFENLASLWYFSLQGLHKIEKIEGLQHCTSLGYIIIKDCPKLNLLLEKLASLTAFEVTNCNKLENIEGIQQCSGLNWLCVENTCWGAPSIESLGQMQGLGTPQLDGRCIPKMKGQKWPREIIICRKVVPGTGSFLNSSDFPDLYLLHSFANKTVTDDSLTVEVRGKSSSNDNENAIMLCLVINCLSPHTTLYVDRYWSSEISHLWRPNKWRFRSKMEEGKWIWIGIFTPMETGGKFFIRADVSQNRNEVEKGMLLKGKVNNVAEAFWRIVARLGN